MGPSALPLAPRRTRVAGVLALLIGAPIFAELIQSYLTNTGDVLELGFTVLFLAPLYGGAALLIREVAVRTGRGWPGRLLLAAAFGVLMTTTIDVSLFTPERADVDYWDDIMSTTMIGAVSVYAVTSWVMGHVLMSIGAPLAVVEGALPRGRGRPWLGPIGLVVLTALGVAVAWFIHQDESSSQVVEASAVDYTVSALVVLALVAAAMGPWGRPLTTVSGRQPGRPLSLGVAGFVLMLAFDMVPISWLGVAVDWIALIVAGVLVGVRSRSPAWTWRHITAFAYGGMLARTLTGFLSPVPPGVEESAKLGQNLVFLLIVLAIGVLLWVRTRADVSTGAVAM